MLPEKSSPACPVVFPRNPCLFSAPAESSNGIMHFQQKHTEPAISVGRGLLWNHVVPRSRLLWAREIKGILLKAAYHHDKKCIWGVDAFCTELGIVASRPSVALRGLSAHPLVLLQHLAITGRGTPPRAASCFPKS